MEDADGSTRRRDRPHEPFHRFVARAVAVLLDQVLPDPLDAQAGVELLGDRRRHRAAAANRGAREPGNVLAGFDPEPANVLAAFESPAADASAESPGGEGSEPGNVLAGFDWRAAS